MPISGEQASSLCKNLLCHHSERRRKMVSPVVAIGRVWAEHSVITLVARLLAAKNI